MNFRKEILKEYSKAQTLKIAKFVGNDQERFARIMELYFDDDLRICQRSSWIVGHCAERFPELILPYLKEMIDKLEAAPHNAVRRNTVRILQDIELPEKLLGKVVDICFRLLDDPQEAIAVRVFSMGVLYNACLREPDLKDELRLVIEDHIGFGSAGFKSRGKKILKALQQLNA